MQFEGMENVCKSFLISVLFSFDQITRFICHQNLYETSIDHSNFLQPGRHSVTEEPETLFSSDWSEACSVMPGFV